MSPRIIHLPLSGSLRSAQAKGIRAAHGLADGNRARADRLRTEADGKIREALKLECEAWSALMWAGGPAQPSPTLGEAVSIGFTVLKVQCESCKRQDDLDLRKVKRRPDTELWRLEASLSCRHCRTALHYRPKAHIVGLEPERGPDPEADRKKSAAR